MDFKGVSEALDRYLRPASVPVAVKYFESLEELQAVERVRMPEKVNPPCVIINQASQFGWTAACLREKVHADYCRGIHGMFERDGKWYSGEMFLHAWFDDIGPSKAHNAALTCLPAKYVGMVAAPLSSGRLQEPDVIVMYLTPSQAFLLLSAWQFDGYEKLEFTFSGESTCSDSWVSTILTGKPKVSLPCFAERKFGGVRETEVCVSMTPADLERAVEGLKKLHRNGLRYPIASYSLTSSILGGLPASYDGF